MLRLVIIVFALLITGIAYSNNPSPRSGELQSPDQSNRTKHKTEPKQEQRGTEQAPILKKIAESPTTQDEAQDEATEAKRIKEEKAEAQRHTEAITSANNAVIASWIQAVALIVTIGVMIWTARRQLRAYVAVTPNNLIGPNLPTHPVRYKFTLINHGKTPAYKLTDTAMVDIFPYPLPPNFVFPDLPEPHGRLVLHPNVLTYFGEARAVRQFTVDEINEMADGTRRRLYIFGVVKYVDVFRKAHTTQFCHSVVGHLGMLPFFHGAPSADGQRFNSESADQHDYTD